MANKVTVNVESSPEGELLEIPGLGTVPNGSTKDLEDYQVQLFEEQGFTFPEDGHLTIKLPADPVETLKEAPKDDLQARVIEGRSSMNKDQLAKAIAKAEGSK